MAAVGGADGTGAFSGGALGGEVALARAGGSGDRSRRAEALLQTALSDARACGPVGGPAWREAKRRVARAYIGRLLGDADTNHARAVAAAESVRDHLGAADEAEQVTTLVLLAVAYKHSTGAGGEDLRERSLDLLREARRLASGDGTMTRLVDRTEGNVLLVRRRGDKATNRRRALSCFRAALATCPADNRVERAVLLTNMGNAYNGWPTRRRRRALHRALALYRQALELLDPDTEPAHVRRAARNSADMRMRLGRWTAAAADLVRALDAVESLLADSWSHPDGRDVEVLDADDLPLRLAFCLALAGRTHDAAAVLEQYASRLSGAQCPCGSGDCAAASPPLRGGSPSARFMDAARHRLAAVRASSARNPRSPSFLYAATTVSGTIVLAVGHAGVHVRSTGLFRREHLRRLVSSPAWEGGRGGHLMSLLGPWDQAAPYTRGAAATLAGLGPVSLALREANTPSAGELVLLPFGQLAVLPLAAAGTAGDALIDVGVVSCASTASAWLSSAAPPDRGSTTGSPC